MTKSPPTLILPLPFLISPPGLSIKKRECPWLLSHQAGRNIL
jgi:hypothetical protein